MNGDQMALAVGGKFSDDESTLGEQPHNLVAVILAASRLLDIEDRRVEGRHLHAFVAHAGRPIGERLQLVEGRLRRNELRQKHRGPLDRPHRFPP